MMLFASSISILLALFTQPTVALFFPPTTGQCPPTELTPKSTLNVTDYVSERWYSMKQFPTSYQPVNKLYCTFAEYTPVDTFPWWCAFGRCRGSARIEVFNYCNENGVNGPESTAELYGIAYDPVNDPARLEVGFKNLPGRLFGDYWVIEAGTYDQLLAADSVPPYADFGTYEWALISAGAPDEEVSETGGCRNSGGFWYFSRSASPPAGFVAAMDDLAISLGFDISGLVEVPQDGCIYA